ncbi:MAG: hypothetical protein ACQESG_02470 [Nanobdellota archaeon]
MKLINKETDKPPLEVIRLIKDNAHKFEFIIRDVFDMNQQFQRHGVSTEDFEFYSIMVCNPKKAYKTMKIDPRRGAVILPPKQITVYTQKRTIISYLAFTENDAQSILPDESFQKGLAQSCDNIIRLIESVL